MLGKADLHMHTTASFDGTATVRATLKQAASHAGLDVIAITDHDQVRASLEARSLAADYGIEVITGAEISTREGHVVALFIERDIPAKLSLIETVIRIGAQGGIAIAAHPNQPTPTSLPFRSIAEAAAHAEAGTVLRGIEYFNMNPTHSPFNRRSQQAARRLNLAHIGSSDAHLPDMVGAGVTRFVGKTAQDLRQSILNGHTQAEAISAENPTRVLARWIWHYTLRKLGWVTGNLGADLPLGWMRQRAT